MASKADALKVAAEFGFELDESVTGLVGGCFSATFDHPTHSIAGECRSIHVSDYGTGSRSPACCAWTDAIDRMRADGPLLSPCEDANCEYHAA